MTCNLVAIFICFGGVLGFANAAISPPPPTARELKVLSSTHEYDKNPEIVNNLSKVNQEFNETLMNELLTPGKPRFTQRTSLPPISRPDWMAKVPDDQSLAHMSIPGTHESCAQYGGWISQCQDTSITDQLNKGIRFLDIRCRVFNDIFTIHHGIVYQKIVFGQVLNECLEFLNNHPTETIIMRVKQEYSEASNDEFNKIFDVYRKEKGYKGDYFGDRMYTDYRVPNLGEVRGKIVIVENVYGLPGIRWGSLDKQDDYNVPTLFHMKDKWEKVRSHLDKSAHDHNSGSRTMFLNFATGSGGLFPMTVARYLNKALYSFLGSTVYDFMPPKGNGFSHYGIVAMDFPEYYDDGVIEQLIRRNKVKK